MPDESAALERARVESRQMPIFTRDLRALAADMRLDWVKARSLWAAGFLSFDPDGMVAGDEVREAEFVFVGSLAAIGIPHDVLDVMLRGLRKPFAYDGSRIYFHWQTRTWRLLPDPDDPEAAFFALLTRLDPQREAEVLLEIRDLVENALDLARGRRHLFGHERPPRAPVNPPGGRTGPA